MLSAQVSYDQRESEAERGVPRRTAVLTLLGPETGGEAACAALGHPGPPCRQSGLPSHPDRRRRLRWRGSAQHVDYLPVKVVCDRPLIRSLAVLRLDIVLAQRA